MPRTAMPALQPFGGETVKVKVNLPLIKVVGLLFRGPLSRDRRGQLALAWQFDPRNIAGRPLEAYPWIAVVATGGPCALALTPII